MTGPDDNRQEKKHTDISTKVLFLETEPLQNLDRKNIIFYGSFMFATRGV